MRELASNLASQLNYVLSPRISDLDLDLYFRKMVEEGSSAVVEDELPVLGFMKARTQFSGSLANCFKVNFPYS